MLPPIADRIATELDCRPPQVAAAVGLLDGGATVPFIARYRKEVTGGLDDTQLRTLNERLSYMRELEERRKTVLNSIAEQGKLTPELEAAVNNAETKQRLEDLYLPYKPKRRTKAMVAREAGLEPLAHALLADPTLDPETSARDFVDDERGVGDAKAALEGARHILMEDWGEDAELTAELRQLCSVHGYLTARVVEGKEREGAKFRDYFAHEEKVAAIPSHRALALLRGQREGILRLALALEEELRDEPPPRNRCEKAIARRAGVSDAGRPADPWLLETVRFAWVAKLGVRLELDLVNELRQRAEDEAIHVFANNLHDLLLAAPAGPRVVAGLDPGLRTGVKVAVVDRTGKLLDTGTIYPHPPRNDWAGALAALTALVEKHDVELISIGNGTASRETDRLAKELVAQIAPRPLQRVMVSEAGASVYSASALAAAELSELDVSLRGAVSIARRLQDPLAELVKIDPKSIGVGQYQHDVNQAKLALALDAAVEDCVNAVGVDVNTASPALLARVSGLNQRHAANIVSHRDAHGAFRTRSTLLDVPRFGAKTFELAAGFLRIRDGDNPLDASAVHPEAYPVVERILAHSKRQIDELIGDSTYLRSLKPERFTDRTFGLPTVRDILVELDKPGRDPRPDLVTASFKQGVETLADLEPGMLLEGAVTNVTNFGAFVDVGVHQDGLVHISAMADRFVKDPREIVKAGDIVRVAVLDVDMERKRISLTMRLDSSPTKKRPKRDQRDRSESREGRGKKPISADPSSGIMAAAFAKHAGKKKDRRRKG